MDVARRKNTSRENPAIYQNQLVTLEHLEMLKEELLNRIKNMLDELEQLLENSKREIVIKDINWNELILSVLTRYKKEINDGKIKIEIAVDQPFNFSSDRLRLYLILSHVVENAIQFQKEVRVSHTIHIEVHTHTSKGIVSIADNGIGINEKVQDKIFELFYRATSASKGVGVGLYVVREALDKMGGSITVDSALGTGSVFRLTIPNLISSEKS